jgi:hypothetical protein
MQVKKQTSPYWQSRSLSHPAPIPPSAAQVPHGWSPAIRQYPFSPGHCELSPQGAFGESEPGNLHARGGLATTTSSQLAES